MVISQSLLPSKRGIPQLLGEWTRPEENHAWLNTRPLESNSLQQPFQMWIYFKYLFLAIKSRGEASLIKGRENKAEAVGLEVGKEE